MNTQKALATIIEKMDKVRAICSTAKSVREDAKKLSRNALDRSISQR